MFVVYQAFCNHEFFLKLLLPVFPVLIKTGGKFKEHLYFLGYQVHSDPEWQNIVINAENENSQNQSNDSSFERAMIGN